MEEHVARARDGLRRLRSGPKTLSPEAMMDAMMQAQAFNMGSLAAVPPPIQHRNAAATPPDAAASHHQHANEPHEGAGQSNNVYVLSGQPAQRHSAQGANAFGMQSHWRAVLPARYTNDAAMPGGYRSQLAACCNGPGQLHPDTGKVYSLLLSSGLSRDVLGQIWSVANQTMPGQLTRQEFFVALDLTGLAQSGQKPSLDTLNSATVFSVPKFSSGQGAKAKSPFADSAAALQASCAKVAPRAATSKAVESVSKSSEPSVKSLELSPTKCTEDSVSTGSDPGRLQPTKIYDKYAALKEAAGTNDTAGETLEEHLAAWKRILEAAQSCLAECATLFLSSTDTSVCRSVVQTEKGQCYIKAIGEVYRVACRIKVSLKTTTFQTDFLLDLMASIEDSWQTIVNCTGCHSALQCISSMDLSSALASASCTDANNFCAVCLLRVEADAQQPQQRQEQHGGKREEEWGKIEFAGRKYHRQCANFWVNKVDAVLPSLALPTKLL